MFRIKSLLVFNFLFAGMLLASCVQQTAVDEVETSQEEEREGRFVILDTLSSAYQLFFDQNIDTTERFSDIKGYFDAYGYREGGLQHAFLHYQDSIRESRAHESAVQAMDDQIASTKFQNLSSYIQFKTFESLLEQGLLTQLFNGVPYGFEGYGYVGKEEILRLNQAVGIRTAKDKEWMRKLMLFDNSVGEHYDFSNTMLELPSSDLVRFDSIRPKDKKMILLFGATWCSPCKINDRLLKRWYSDIDTSKVVFLNISIDSDKDVGKWRDYLEDEDYPFANYRLPENQKEDYGRFQLAGVPKLFLFDEESRLKAYGMDTRYMLKSIPEATRFEE